MSDRSYVCPACRYELRDLACSRCGREFPTVAGLPVLIDFSTSIVDADAVLNSEASSAVPRRHGAGYQRLRRLVFGSGTVTRRNAAAFVEEVLALAERPRVLDIGGATVGGGSDVFREDPRISVTAFDVYASPRVNFIADAHQIPLPDASFDGVWVQAVLEHVLTPTRVVDEIERVLRPGGIVYAETPFMQHVHEGAYDFTRFTHSGHRWLFRRFEEIDSGVVAGAGTQLLWSVDRFARAITRSRTAGKAVKALLFWLRWFDRLADEADSVDVASCCYFLGRGSERALEPRDMPAYYRGADR